MRLTESILKNLEDPSDKKLLDQLIKAIDDGDMKTAYTIWYNVSDYPEDLDELQKYEHFKRMTDFYSAIPDEQVAKLERYMKGVEMDAYGDTNIGKDDTVMYKPLGKKLSFEELKNLKRQDLRNNKVGWVGTDTSKFSDEEIEREANNLAREDWFTYKRMNESFDMDLLNYMLDNDIIIGAEYDHPEEYDDKHWKILYGEALDKAKEDNNSEMLNKLEKVLKENYIIVEREFITDRVTEYVITFNDGELYDEYGGEFITEDKREADEMFNEIRQRGDIDQVSQYYKKDWVKLDTYDDYVEDDVDVYYTQGDNLEYLNIGSDLNEAKEIEEFPCEGGGTCIRAKDIPEAKKYWKIMQDIGMDPENLYFNKGVTEEDIRKDIISEIEWYMDMVHPPADWETLEKNYDLLVGSHEPTPNEVIHKYADKVASELRSKKGSKLKESEKIIGPEKAYINYVNNWMNERHYWDEVDFNSYMFDPNSKGVFDDYLRLYNDLYEQNGINGELFVSYDEWLDNEGHRKDFNGEDSQWWFELDILPKKKKVVAQGHTKGGKIFNKFTYDPKTEELIIDEYDNKEPFTRIGGSSVKVNFPDPEDKSLEDLEDAIEEYYNLENTESSEDIKESAITEAKRVYDDEVDYSEDLNEVFHTVCDFIDEFENCPTDFATYDERVNRSAVVDILAQYLRTDGYTLDKERTYSLNDIGNNMRYELFKNEECIGYISVNVGLYSDAYIYIEDLKGNRVGGAWEIHGDGRAWLKECVKESVLTEEVDTDVTSPLELNTGVLPILNTNTYGMEDYIWDFYDTPNDDGSYIPEDEQPTFDDLKEVMKTYAQPVLEERIKKVLPSAKVTTTGVWSPQYYNFEGDQVEFTVSFNVAEFNDLMNKALADPNFESYLKDKYKSYDGFISYMADNLDEFNSQDGWKKFVQVIMFYAEDYDNEDDIFDFWEKVRENF